MTRYRPPSPRLLTKQQAAGYLGVCAATLERWVAKGRIPGALPDLRKWDRASIDAAIDQMSGLGDAGRPVDAYSQWKQARDANNAPRRS